MRDPTSSQVMVVVHTSVITCPRCGRQRTEAMPEYSCAIFYLCTGCGATLRPLADDCCVFCSYGTVPCPPIQRRAARLH